MVTSPMASATITPTVIGTRHISILRTCWCIRRRCALRTLRSSVCAYHCCSSLEKFPLVGNTHFQEPEPRPRSSGVESQHSTILHYRPQLRRAHHQPNVPQQELCHRLRCLRHGTRITLRNSMLINSKLKLMIGEKFSPLDRYCLPQLVF